MPARSALESQAKHIETIQELACTQTSLGPRDALILDFGALHPGPEGELSGDIVVVVECPWRIDSPDMPVVGWEDDEDAIALRATSLIGGLVTRIEVRRPGFDLALHFSNGLRMQVFPDCRAYYSEELSAGALPWRVVGRQSPDSGIRSGA